MDIILKLIGWLIFGVIGGYFGFLILMMFVIGPIYTLVSEILEKFFPNFYRKFKGKPYQVFQKYPSYTVTAKTPIIIDNSTNSQFEDNESKLDTFFDLFGEDVLIVFFMCICLSLGNYYFYRKAEINIAKQHIQAVNNYDDLIRERNYIKSQIERGGTICNDGWKSYSSGQGTCSHHGGIDHSISPSRYRGLEKRIGQYEIKKSNYWFDSQINLLKNKHYWIEFFIVAGLIWIYAILRKSRK